MSDFYNGLQSTAARLLAQFGKPLTLRVQTGAAYDPGTQTNVPTYTDHPVNGVIDGATVYVVQTVKALNPAGTPLLYELQGRR